ncbi:MAG: DsbA family protein [bacterium]|nr:DsbA family protein [bacterium]
MEQNQQNTFLIPLAIVVAGGFVAAAIYFGTDSGSPTTTINTDPQNTEINLVPVTEKDHILGSRDATLVIVEYSDTECPFCKTFHYTMKEIVQTYDGEVAWVYRHFPIAQLHTKAIKEAEATECANELGGNQAFWKYLDNIFATTNSNNSLDPSELPKIATAVGLDVTAFNSCLSSGRYTEFVKKSVAEAIKAGALGTPYSIILTKDGQKILINGAEPIAMVKTKIDALLK